VGAHLPWEAALKAALTEGPAKTIDGPPVHLLNPRPALPTGQLFVACLFLNYVFGRLSVRGVQKHHKIFLQKLHVENFSQKNRQKFRCQFSLDFFGCIAFSGVSQRWEFKNTTKNVWQKNHVEEFLQKN
jgi:hypothetical protein